MENTLILFLNFRQFTALRRWNHRQLNIRQFPQEKCWKMRGHQHIAHLKLLFKRFKTFYGQSFQHSYLKNYFTRLVKSTQLSKSTRLVKSTQLSKSTLFGLYDQWTETADTYGASLGAK